MNAKIERLIGLWIVPLLSVASLAAPTSGDLSLIDAVRNANTEAVHLLLKEGADVNAAQADGATALAWAAHRGDLEIAYLLIAAGANANAANDYGITPLWLACSNGNAAMVEKLLKAGANPNAPLLRTQEMPLMTCSRTGNAEAVKSLLVHGAEVNAKETWRGQTALMWAVAEGQVKAARVLIEHGADVHARSNRGFTPLLFAARVGDVDLARILLDAGSDVDEGTKQDGSALVVASASGHEAFTTFLLDKGADSNAADGYGMTALHYAVQKGLSDLSYIEYKPYLLPPPNMTGLVKALLRHGADPNTRIAKDYERNMRAPFRQSTPMSLVGATAFFLAAASGDANLMRVLAEGGANPRLGTKDKTPIMVAAGTGRAQDFLPGEESNFLEAIQLAVQLGDDINAPDADGQTALHAAASVGANSIVQFLVDKGAKVNAKDKTGQTPWTIAMAMVAVVNSQGRLRLHESTADLLLKLGAVPLTVKDLQTPPKDPQYRVNEDKTKDVSKPVNPVTVQAQ
ncbi:MAG: ankyrin repeat domain-containing protein [Acidobacteria bacterium]|nr:ankyrin repeat domain-containing protein [Acidobacteriota bacterium]